MPDRACPADRWCTVVMPSHEFPGYTRLKVTCLLLDPDGLATIIADEIYDGLTTGEVIDVLDLYLHPLHLHGRGETPAPVAEVASKP